MNVFLLDEDFRNFEGHHASYDLPLQRELKNSGLNAVIVADDECALPEAQLAEGIVIPLFRKRRITEAAWTKWLPRPLRRVYRVIVGNAIIYRDLVGLAREYFKGQDVIIACRPTSQVKLAYAFWLLHLWLHKNRVTLCLVLHNRPHLLFSFEALWIAVCGRGHAVHYLAHSDQVAKLASEKFGLRCHVLPLPLAHVECGDNNLNEDKGRALTFATLGIGAKAKGIDLILRAMRGLQASIKAGDVRFIIQSYGDDAVTNVAQELGAGAKAPGCAHCIEVIGTAMSRADYEKVLCRADVVLLPYHRLAYEIALSGVFVETLSAGKPVIVTAGTYMGRLVEDFGNGCLIDDQSVESLIEAINYTFNNINMLRSAALRIREPWRQRHSANECARAIKKLLVHHAKS